MDIFWEEIMHGLPDRAHLIRVLIRLVAATIMGGIIGMQRERMGKPAGIRTHILAAVGSCIFVLACIGYGMSTDGLSRVIQGIVTGIGFLGAGSILKLDDKRDIQGLTTAASIYSAAAIGVAVGLGGLGLAIISAILTLIVLAMLGSIEFRIEKNRASKAKD